MFFLQDISYMLKPVSATARVCRNSSKTPLSTKDGPRFYVDVLFDAVEAALSNKQYKSLTEIFEETSMFFKKKANKKWRPFVSIQAK